jgi:hypothetical protein
VSDSERPDQAAFRELEGLVRGLGAEMGNLRRRAQQAEARARDLERAKEPPTAAQLDDRVAALERENQELRARLDTARQRTLRLLDRMRFIRQQHEREARR